MIDSYIKENKSEYVIEVDRNVTWEKLVEQLKKVPNGYDDLYHKAKKISFVVTEVEVVTKEDLTY
jgi:hypothetical protein